MKKLYALLIASVIAAAAVCFAVENMGYHSITVDGGAIYGKIMGSSKDVIVLIAAGSGPTDMDGNTPLVNGRNDSLLQIAEGLQKNGISTFRYDKRVTGKSKDTFKKMIPDFDLFVDDCTAAIRYLKKLGYKKVILAGHSEGALIAMLSALKEPVDGYISIAGTGYPIDITLERQLKSAKGQNSEYIRILKSLRSGFVDTSISADDPILSPENQKYLLTWMKYNPSEIIKKLDIPIMLIQGDADLQTNIDDFLALKAGRKDSQSVVMNGMNHVLKKVTDSKQNEESYTDPSYTLHDELTPALVRFINTIKI